MLTEKRRDILFGRPTRRNVPNQLFEFVFARCQQKTVQIEEHIGGRTGDAFVTVDKGMVCSKVEQVGGSHLKQVRMSVDTSKARGRHRNRGQQQSHIAQAGAAAVPLELIAMDREHLV